MAVNYQTTHNIMIHSSKQGWIRSTLLNVSLSGKPIQLGEGNNSDELELQRAPLQEVIPYTLSLDKGSKARKRFQARTRHRRDWECRSYNYRQEKLIDLVRRKQLLELRSTFSDEAQRAMGILHVQSSLLQKLAREENSAKELSGAIVETSPIDEGNPEVPCRSTSRDLLLREVGSAVATLWV